MGQLQPYPITEFKSGIITYQKPWMRPQDAWEPLVNAYVYRGSVSKRNGYTTFGNRLADHNPVMGIIQRINQSTSETNLLVASTQNLYKYNTGANTFDAITSVSASNFWQGTATGTINIPTFWPNLTPGTVSITDGVTTITDNGVGGFGGLPAGIFDAGTTINYTTGVFHVVFVGTTAGKSLSITATSTNYFTGNNTQFFNYVNWQPTDPATFLQSSSYTIMVNGKDPVTYYDGTNLTRPILYVDSAKTNYITTAQDIEVYSNSLMLMRPNLFSQTNSLNQTICYSFPFNAFNFVNDIAGNGGQVTVATGDIYRSHEILRNAIILFFSNSTWILQYTAIPSFPFKVDRLSVNKRNNCPYASVAYDERCTSLGSTGFIACDGVNVQRYDIPIVDFFETEISEQYYNQVFSQRYDNLNQTWMLYVSNGTSNPVIGSGAPGADKALIYNHVENTWATYTWSIPMSCMGTYFVQTGLTWAQLTQQWQNTPAAWNSYQKQKLAPILLMGDVSGNVYLMDDDTAITDNGDLIPIDMVSARWNPSILKGEKSQFAHIDFYYSLDAFQPVSPVTLTLTFYIDDSENQALVQTLTLDGPLQSTYNWKRIYCNLIGQFLRVEISSGEEDFFEILGLVIWAGSAGRLTAPGPLRWP